MAQEFLALGLMSGTSADGISAAVVSFRDQSFKLRAYETFPYPRKIQDQLGRALKLRLPEISQLNFHIGECFAKSALKLLKRARIRPDKLAVVGSHGQTVYHGPEDPVPSTFQIGEAAVIARKLGVPVVSDFRSGDVALGGQGAPLIPFFDVFFYTRKKVRALQNIGGIANVTLTGKDLKTPIAFDTGPGNCLIDLSMRKITRRELSHDPSGQWAAKGRVREEWIRELFRHPYFKRKPPKSTGREEFGEEFLETHFGERLKSEPYDVLATLTRFSAQAIFESIRRFSPVFPREVIVSGGGVKNLTLMKHLKKYFSPVPVFSIEKWGVPLQAKEPIAFAFLGLRTLLGLINHLPQATGAKRAAILGKIILPV